MNRGTDPALIAEKQPDSDDEMCGSVLATVELVGQLVVPRDGQGPSLFLPNAGDLAKSTGSIRPTLKALADVGQQIAASGVKTLGKRIAQWRKRVNALVKKTSEQNYLSLFEKFLFVTAVKVIGQLLRMASLSQTLGTFVQQVFNSSSLMLTGPPSLSTGLPIKQLVTTWGRVI